MACRWKARPDSIPKPDPVLTASSPTRSGIKPLHFSRLAHPSTRLSILRQLGLGGRNEVAMSELELAGVISVEVRRAYDRRCFASVAGDDEWPSLDNCMTTIRRSNSRRRAVPLL